MIRVLQFGMTYNPGGIESFIMNYYRNIDRKIIQFDFINMYDSIAYEEEIKKLGGRIFKVTSFKKNLFKNYLDIKNLIKKNKYDVVHINALSLAYITPVLVSKKLGVKKIIVHSHNSNMPPGLIRKILHNINKNITLNCATDFLACSEKAGKWMFDKKNNCRNFEIINNAINVEDFKYSEEIRNLIRKELELEGKLVVGNVARFSYQKNHSFLIDVFYELQNKNSDSVLLLIGDGELRTTIEKKVNQLGIEEKVKFLGIRKNINDLMQSMDVFVLTSYFEGLAVVGIEAQANGLPILLSDTITKELNMSENSKFISLNKPTSYWANEILKFNNLDINREIPSVIDNGYNIIKEVKRLENIYRYNLY